MTLTPGMGIGGDHLGPKIPPNHNKAQKQIRTKMFTLLGHVSTIMSKSIFKISSYIQKTTLNPISAFKISIYDTKHTQNTKVHFQKKQKKQKEIQQKKTNIRFS